MKRRPAKPVIDWDDVPVIMDTAYAAHVLGFSKIQVQHLCAEGLLPAFRFKQNGSWRIRREDLRENIEGLVTGGRSTLQQSQLTPPQQSDKPA